MNLIPNEISDCIKNLLWAVEEELLEGATEMRSMSKAALGELEQAILKFAREEGAKLLIQEGEDAIKRGDYISIEQLKAEAATRLVPEETKHDQN